MAPAADKSIDLIRNYLAFSVIAGLLAGCGGGGGNDLDEGEDLSDSALLVSAAPAARIVINWDTIEDTDNYKVSVDRDADTENGFEYSALVVGASTTAGTDQYIKYTVDATTVSTLEWDSVQLKVESCDNVVVDDVATVECDDDELGYSIDPVPAGNLLFEWAPIKNTTTYRLFADLKGSGTFKLLASDLPPDQLYYVFDPAALEIDWRDARFMLESCVDDVCKNVGEQRIRGLSPGSVRVFGPPPAVIHPLYGASMALSEDGNTMVVGAPGESEFTCDEISGIAEVDVPALLEELEPSEPFPYCLYIIPTDTIRDPEDPEDDWVAPTSLTEFVLGAGVAYVYTRDELGWTQTSRLEAPIRREADNMGWAVALSADGSTLAVSARFEDSASTGVGGEQDATDNEALDSGAVYIYGLEDGDWVFQEYIKATNTEAEDLFGWTLALSADGNTLAVSSVLEEASGTDQENNDLERAGAVYTYTRADGVWTPQDFLKPAAIEANDLFGVSLALSADGQIMAVGAIEEGEPPSEIDGRFRICNPVRNPDSGSVYIFQRDGDAWSESATLRASNGDKADCFGFAVTLNADGSRLAVGAPLEDSIATGVNGRDSDDSQPNSGAAYLYERSGTAWAQTDYFKASNTGTPDQFGASVALSSSGDALVVGAIGESSASLALNGSQEFNTAPGAGAAYAFRLKNDRWRQVAFIKSPQPQSAATFGWRLAVAKDGEQLAVSSPGWELNTGYTGLVFIY